VERTINALKNSRAVAARFDRRVYVFHGAVAVTAIPVLAPGVMDCTAPSAGRRLLSGLTRHAKLPCRIGLRHILLDEALHQVTPLGGELLDQEDTPD
jgi:hypothetical protein